MRWAAKFKPSRTAKPTAKNFSHGKRSSRSRCSSMFDPSKRQKLFRSRYTQRQGEAALFGLPFCPDLTRDLWTLNTEYELFACLLIIFYGRSHSILKQTVDYICGHDIMAFFCFLFFVFCFLFLKKLFFFLTPLSSECHFFLFAFFGFVCRIHFDASR